MTTEHPAVERRRTLDAGAALFAELRALLDRNVEKASLHAEGATDWNSRDVYAHFARWIGFTIEQVQRKAAGLDWLPPIPGTDDEINERWAVQDRTLTLDQARDWCIASVDTLTSLINDLSVDQWQRFGRKTVDDIGGDHVRAHIEFIRSAAAS
jgi:hypothetical protein